MYADDAVVLTHGKSYSEVSKTLTSVMSNLQEWLTASCLYLNTQKTVCMAFSKKPVVLRNSNVFLRGEELSLVTEFKYLGVTLDPTLSYKKHVKKVIRTINFSLRNFRQIRSSLTEEAAKIFMHSMIFSHIEYCFTNWSLTGKTILKPIESLYKKPWKLLTKNHSLIITVTSLYVIIYWALTVLSRLNLHVVCIRLWTDLHLHPWVSFLNVNPPTVPTLEQPQEETAQFHLGAPPSHSLL